MNRFLLYLFLLVGIVLAGCRDDESHSVKSDTETGNINFAVTGRIGTAVGADITTYVKALNLLLFKENSAGDYLLVRSLLLDKNDLSALNNSDEVVAAGFTTPKTITFDTLSVGNYRIVGVGNIRDSLGGVLPNASLDRVQVGATLAEVLANVPDGSEAPRLFWGITDVVAVGADQPTPPILKLYRKVAMFALTVKDIPAVVNRITMEIQNTYGTFNMLGDFPADSDIFVLAATNYTLAAGDSVNLTYITLPTLAGGKSNFVITFYLGDGSKQVISLPQYVLKENTITKLTATIDVDQPGNIWKVNLGAIISVNVEWNIDQEPPIII